MVKFSLGLIIGIFIIPIIKEVYFQTGFERGVREIFKHPIDFIKEVLHRTFIGGY
jgi:hypothetical protein